MISETNPEINISNYKHPISTIKMKTTPKISKAVRIAVMLLACIGTANAQTATDEPLFHWLCTAGDSSLNFNPAAYGGGNTVFDSLPYSKDYTMIVVYKPVADTEASVWRLDYGGGYGSGDHSTRGLTTERILSDSIAIRYAPQTDLTPVISTLRQSAPDSVSPYVRLVLNDNVKVAEILYYGRRMGNAALRKVQSVLAVRYGVTLGPVDWHTADGVIWRHDSVYRHRVTGVGRDTLSGLCQTESRSEMGGAILTIGADTLPQGAFLLAGDDGNSLDFVSNDGAETLERHWKVQATRVRNIPFTLSIDINDFSSAGDTIVLLVDGDIYLPANTSNGKAVFEDVFFDYDEGINADPLSEDVKICTMAIGRGSAFLLSGQQRGKSGAVSAADASCTVNVYPNPSSGHYTLEVSGARQVQVTIYNLQGTVMGTFNSSDTERHRFEGDLPTGNIYYATVTTESGIQTVKLVVK